MKKEHKNIDFSKRLIALTLLFVFLPSIIPVNYMMANNNGPNAPEASGFEPVGATDMVNLATGDTSYVLPLLNVGEFPITLSYHSGVPLDMESSWTGLGWNINTGAIARGVTASPDDWNNGKALDFIYFQDSEDIYSVNVGYGLSKTAEVGVGLSWGSNKSLSGSVFASLGAANASFSTDLSYSFGVGGGFGSSKANNNGVGGGLSVSGTINGGAPSVGLNVGGRTGNMTAGLGVSLSNSGAAFSISGGFSNRRAYNQGTAGGGGVSIGNYSAGDYDIGSSGFFIPIQAGVFSFSFGYQKVKYSLSKGYDKSGYGLLYSRDAAFTDNSINSEIPSAQRFGDYQNRFVYGDMYDQALPQLEEEFSADYRTDRGKLNFSFAGYDSYEVNATGISGGMQPQIFENAALFGMGYKGKYPNQGQSAQDDKMRVYYHNSVSGTGDYLPQKQLGNNFDFYFKGHFTQNTVIDPLNYTNDFSFNNATNKTLQNYLPTGRIVDNQRKRSGNYVEVFTNEQIRTGQAYGLMAPESLPNSERNMAQYDDKGIGGYKITAPDGKTYHFSLPVYNYERVERTNLKDGSGDHVNEKRQLTPYAAHWLLTAITGPDYIKNDNNREYPDHGDYGYWVRLDHGKWSEGYVWRTPYDGVNFHTNIDKEIGDKDFGNFQYGRKDLYYLDKVVSQTHTAYFVKDIRYDATAAYGDNDDNPLNDPSNDRFVYSYTKVTKVDDDTGNGASPWVYEPGIEYKREYQLYLDKIIVVPTKFDNVSKSTGTTSLNTKNLPGYTKDDSYKPSYYAGGTTQLGVPIGAGGFFNEYNSYPNYLIHNESGVYDVTDFENFDYSKATKTIQLNYNYELAKNSPSSYFCTGDKGNPDKGRLTLKEVAFLGRDLYNYMPSYKFDYKGTNFSYPVGHQENVNQKVKKAKDDWGFIDEQYYLDEYLKTTHNTVPGDTNYESLYNQYYLQYANNYGPDNWSLQSITMPTGAVLDFTYEEDDYHTEGFSRKFWSAHSDELEFKFNATDISGNGTQYSINLDVRKIAGLNYEIDFDKYFTVGEKTQLNLSGCLNRRSSRNVKININKPVEVMAASQTNLQLQFVANAGVEYVNSDDHIGWWTTPDWFSLNNSYNGDVKNSGLYANEDCPQSHPSYTWTMNLNYKLIANTVPRAETGGGIRVKSIAMTDENNNTYTTKYYYNVPSTNKQKDIGNYKSSGITSFSPTNGLKFIPYQSELPGAGVMYEYVTMESESSQGTSLGETRYRFHTLKPVYDIFNPSLTMYDDQNVEIFSAEVENANGHPDGLLHADQNVYAKKIHLKVNTSLVGKFRSIEQFNIHGQRVSKTENNYRSGADLAYYTNRGSTTESFQSMKSIFRANTNDVSPVLEKRLLSLSSRTDYSSVLESVTNYSQLGKTTEKYEFADDHTGAFRRKITELADGSFIKEEKVPAYTKYPAMGSKVDDPNNKHMLTQGALEIVDWSATGNWSTDYSTLAASITTWNDTWTYRDGLGNESQQSDVWRKHKSYVWKEDVDPTDGTFLTTLDRENDYFNWNTNAPVSTNWQKTSEITRYTHWSSPIETKDINGNFASSKLANKDKYVVASGNARYSEMYYSGAEHSYNATMFDGEVGGVQYVTSEQAHTGNNAINISSTSDKGFEVTGQIGSDHYDLSKTFRPGKYKVSFWAYSIKKDPIENIRLIQNGTAISRNDSEDVVAGDWTLLNYYVDLLPNTSFEMYIRAATDLSNIPAGSLMIYDDFRMHPIYASMNSYVYDDDTDELLYILNGNNLGTKYVYDKAGRLCATYSEVANTSDFTGGFKITSQNKYHYQGMYDSDCGCCDAMATTSSRESLSASLEEVENGAYTRVFEVTPQNGSGSYNYQWRWLTDTSNNSYSDFINGTSKQAIPFAAAYCNDKNNSYDKLWEFEVKVTDITTGTSVIKKDKVEISGCTFEVSDQKWADIEISENYDACNTDSRFTFRPFVIKPEHKNYQYQYKVYDVINNQWSNFTTVSNAQGIFCTPYFYVESGSCKDQYIRYHAFQYKVIDTETGNFYESPIINTYLECTSSTIDQSLILSSNSDHEQYATTGTVIERNAQGKINKVYNINEITKK
ncbi:hypothetical protein [Kordia sp.]|uniref:hypothetical protein n=1 Tax=Kordia sp. TaxID=1965332 RepID=UPI0025C3049E|nr:hypothetical protein [Kordia sp.]MCH2196978.1 hypothetical protein [Kordia sp.]